jgi:hypothetical protein
MFLTLGQPSAVASEHVGHRIEHVTPIRDPLYVVVAIENPQMFATRYAQYRAFAKHIEASGAILYTVELALGGRHFEVTDADNPRHIQLRGSTILWRKENLQNIGVSRLPHDWKYVLLADADFHFTRPDWVQATLHALQRHGAVQAFQTYSCLRSDHTVESTQDGFVYAWLQAGRRVGKEGVRGATGGAWAYDRSTWDTLHGMLETPILGSADWYMTYALAGEVDRNKYDRNTSQELERCAPAYIESVNEWCDRATALNRNIGHVACHAIHYWHGPFRARGYGWRWKILTSHAFDPHKDLRREASGLLELAGNKPGMRDEIADYFASRNEDALT